MYLSKRLHAKYECKDTPKGVLMQNKRVIGREVLIACSDLNVPFEIHTDDSVESLENHYAITAVIA